MANDRLRWGLICTARINRALIPAIRASERSELVAVASRDLARAQAYAAEWDIPRAHGSYEALLNDPDVDVIYNALPNSYHHEWTIKAAEAGKSILCEKPLALSVKEVDEMIEAAERNGVVLLEAFMYRFHPQTLKVQELISKGAIGELSFVRGSFSFAIEDLSNVRMLPELGGGSLWDVGCYPVSFARAITGNDPETLFGWQVEGPTGVDVTFAGQMRFASGVLAQFDSGFHTSFRQYAEVVGSEGWIILERPWKPNDFGPVPIRLVRQDGEEQIEVETVSPYLCEVEAITECILNNAGSLVPLSDSRGNVATINALYDSARRGAPVPLSEWAGK